MANITIPSNITERGLLQPSDLLNLYDFINTGTWTTLTVGTLDVTGVATIATLDVTGTATVPAATASGQAVNLGQVANSASGSLSASNSGSGTSISTTTASFTTPTVGYFITMMFATNSGSGSAGSSWAITASNSAYNPATHPTGNSVQSLSLVGQTSSVPLGTTLYFTASANWTISGTTEINIIAFFIPTP